MLMKKQEVEIYVRMTALIKLINNRQKIKRSLQWIIKWSFLGLLQWRVRCSDLTYCLCKREKKIERWKKEWGGGYKWSAESCFQISKKFRERKWVIFSKKEKTNIARFVFERFWIFDRSLIRALFWFLN